MASQYKSRDIDKIVDQAERGTPKPKPSARDEAMKKAEARFARGRARASDSRIQGNLDLARKAAKDLLQGTMDVNRLKRNQSTDLNQ